MYQMKNRWFSGAASLGAAALIFGAAAMAQPSSTGASTMAQATGTASSVATSAATSVATGTAGGARTATVATTGTVQLTAIPVPTSVISSNIYVAGGTG